jgi:sulfite reductase (NADPH) flavoprotein alpha-component
MGIAHAPSSALVMHLSEASSLFEVYPAPVLSGLKRISNATTVDDASTEEMNSTSLPFSQPVPFASLAGPTYVTTQLLVQQVAYTLSDKLFTYSPETFDLDLAIQKWHTQGEVNANGYPTSFQPMQVRNGAGSIALGYMFSRDFDLKKRHIPQGILATSSSLQFLRPALEQLSLLYSVANPFVAHVAAVDYAGSKAGELVPDYTAAMSLAEELGFGLVSSRSAYESQHMALFATVLAQIMPMVHVYDGAKVGRETTRVIDVLDRVGLRNSYQSILKEAAAPDTKHLDVEGKAIRFLKAFNEELGTDYNFFEYAGHTAPETVLVSFGTVESSLAAQVASALSKTGSRVGAINVRVYRPFVEEQFLRVLPTSTRVIVVLGQVQDSQSVQDVGIHSYLYEDVLATLSFAGRGNDAVDVREFKYPRSQVWTPVDMAGTFGSTLHRSLLPGNDEVIPSLSLLDESVQQYSFWEVIGSRSANAANFLAQALSKNSSNNVTTCTTHDNLMQGGTQRIDIRNSAISLEAPYSVQAADVSFVGDVELLKKVDLISLVKSGGKLVLKLPNTKDEDVEKKLPAAFKKAIVDRGIQLYLIDLAASKLMEEDQSVESLIVQTAFLRLALSKAEEIGLQKLSAVNGTHLDKLDRVVRELERTLRQVETPKSWADIEIGDKHGQTVPINISSNSFATFDKEEVEPSSMLHNWQKAAKALLFKEAYGTKDALRPDLTSKTYTVHIKENRRLTPLTYDRNIFHIEFDIGDSGLKYNIGEALGIHAENDPADVMEFINFYGLDPEEVVEVASRENPEVFENRTIYQSLIQNIDIFGRPPKRFYEALSEFADDEDEKKELLTLGGPEGAKEFQRRAEVDTVTYADILLEFPSAHPSFHEIVRIISPMKRREYSIASCQAVAPKSVALMVVVVGWVDPKGRDRFGQATKYLWKLKPGSPVTVSVKPSVMKLPPKSTQPLIMAGLGTGLAPFRAFVQHRAMEKAQGKEIGAVLLYMGSRHQREEYCYGEDWEAYQAAGVITLLGRAFSRDQPQKIYIQDRMRQTMADIVQAYIKEDGAFYLCGPTWPVPDVTNVLEEAIAKESKYVGRKVDPRKEIERLKDDGRYVLEVY